jgi:hypothetical protein
MRILTVIGALAAATLLGGWSFDRQGPYCLQDRQSTNCGYPSLEACVVTTRGAGGYCYPNPKYVDPRDAEPRPRRSRSW